MKLSKIGLICLSSLLLISGCSKVNAVDKEPSSSTTIITLEKMMAMKDETVYSTINLNGEVKNISVVNRLENVEDGYFYDYGNYQSVINLSSSEKIVVSDGLIKIPVIGRYDSFYYQTALSKSYQLPFNIKTNFYFNDEAVNVNDIVGKKGKVRIELVVTANPLAEKYFYDNYLCQVQVPLNVDKNSNIVSSGATKVIVGKTMTLAFMVLPGQTSTFNITYNTKEFEYEGLTASFSAFNIGDILGFDLSMIPTYIAMLEDGLEAMKNGQVQLKDGLVELFNGLGTLSEGMRQLADGSNTLVTEAAAFYDGIRQINDNLTLLSDGLNQIASNGAAITNGYDQLKSGILQLITTIEPLTTYITSVKEQLDQLKAGLNAYGDGLHQYVNGVNLIATNLTLLSDGMNQLAQNSDLVENGMVRIDEGNKQIADSLKLIVDNTKDVPSNLDLMIEGQQALIDGIKQASEMLNNFPLNGANESIVSFTSTKNVAPRSVQFVVKQESALIRAN